ncbi:MAG TPA: phosphatase PAP2 family protein [Arenimonas sp.]|uniref:phosphatase PAP2 family protein n=1 Tax=Arenimonas sp. TaxID=1872635 RepID=UPI002CCA9E6F|nr:phosphatase PAP2 family protein [Arenimonas sp.]HMB56882.1 phosphatase PAP2 family protein [Arenimonas sp.]
MAANVQAEARFGLAFFRKHGWTLALLFVGVLLPLWGFSELAEDVHAQERFLFDDPTLLWLHARNGPHLDHFFVLMSMLGYGWGVIPADIAIVLWTAWRRRLREGLFFGVAVIGSALLNLGFKQLFSRHRPDLWASIAPEDTFSFPSGHAMGSMTLALAVIVLCWPTRWRWLVLLIALTFALLVAVSRIYLGVHYPSDILAGWSAACAWVLGVYLLVFRLRGNAAN